MKTLNYLLRPTRTLLGLVVAAALLAPLVAAAEESSQSPAAIAWSAQGASALTDSNLIKSPNFGRTAVEVVGLNALVWSYDRYIREGGTNPGFRIGFDSWGAQPRVGLQLGRQQLQHQPVRPPVPRQPVLQRRAQQRLQLWESLPFAFAGSYMWEYLRRDAQPRHERLGRHQHRRRRPGRDPASSGRHRPRQHGTPARRATGGSRRLCHRPDGRA